MEASDNLVTREVINKLKECVDYDEQLLIFGYIRQHQQLFFADSARYYEMPPLIGMLCLFYYHIFEITLSTEDNYDYHNWYDVDLKRKCIEFKVKANNDAHIALGSDKNHNGKHWEIVIGGWNDIFGVKLDKNQFKKFWITWDENYLLIGTGSVVGDESAIIMAHDILKYNQKDIKIKYMSVCTGWGSDGEWIIMTKGLISRFVQSIDYKPEGPHFEDDIKEDIDGNAVNQLFESDSESFFGSDNETESEDDSEDEDDDIEPIKSKRKKKKRSFKEINEEIDTLPKRHRISNNSNNRRNVDDDYTPTQKRGSNRKRKRPYDIYEQLDDKHGEGVDDALQHLGEVQHKRRRLNVMNELSNNKNDKREMDDSDDDTENAVITPTTTTKRRGRKSAFNFDSKEPKRKRHKKK